MKHLILSFIAIISLGGMVHAEQSKSYVQECDMHEDLARKNASVNQYLIGTCFQFGRGREKNLEKAIYWFEKASKAGYKPAIESVNTIYLFDINDKEKTSQALIALEELLNKKYGRAGVVLAVSYHVGAGVEKDDRKSVEYLTEAAKLNIPQAIAGMYYVYKYGLLGENKNFENEKVWLQKLVSYGQDQSFMKETAKEYLARFKRVDFERMISRKM